MIKILSFAVFIFCVTSVAVNGKDANLLTMIGAGVGTVLWVYEAWSWFVRRKRRTG